MRPIALLDPLLDESAERPASWMGSSNLQIRRYERLLQHGDALHR
jgi:hypothetical protein